MLRRHVGWASASGILALLVISAALPAGARPPPPRRPRALLPVGSFAPALHARRIAGPDPVFMGGLAGRVIILDFWATWCGPCQLVMPLLDRLHRRHHARGLTVLGISTEPRRLIESHLRRQPVGYTMAHDTGGTSRAYGVRSIPTLVVIGRQGKVREVMVGVNGPQMRDLVLRVIPQLLAEPVP